MKSSRFLSLICLGIAATSVAQTSDNPLPDWAFGGFVRPEGVNPIIKPIVESTFNCPMKGEAVAWEGADTFNPAAVVKDGTIYVLYRAEDNPNAGIGGRTSRIGLAQMAEDGITVAKRWAEPVFYPTKTELSEKYEWEGGCEDPRVVAAEIDGKTLYVMTYTAWSRGKDGIPRLAIATSDDLEHWTTQGLAFNKAYPDKFERHSCKSGSIVTEIKDGKQVAAKVNFKGEEKYLMYWGEDAVFLATSDDLINWKPYVDEANGNEPIKLMKPRDGYFDSNLTECGPPAILTDKGILLFYNGKNAGDHKADMNYPASTYAAGQALFDLNDPTKVIGRLDNPFFRPMDDAEKSGQYKDGTVFIEGLVYNNDKWYLYYGCADSFVGVAVYDPATAERFGDPVVIESSIDPRIINVFPREAMGKARCYIHSSSGDTGSGESAFYLNTRHWMPNKKWCDNRNEQPWVIWEFFDYYKFDGFGFDDVEGHEPGNGNVPEYWVYVSEDGNDWTEVLHKTDVGDQAEKYETFEPVEGRFVKAVFTRGYRQDNGDKENAIRIYGADIYGEFSRPFDRGDIVSIGKTILKTYDRVNERESALNLINGVYDNKGNKWCFHKADYNNDPIKYVVLDLEDTYDISKFTIRDCKTLEPDENIDHYNILVSEERPDLKLITPKEDGNKCWKTVVSRANTGDEKIKEDVLDSPVRARYVKLEVPRHNEEMNAHTSRVFAFDVHGQKSVIAGVSLSDSADADAPVEYFDLQGRRVRQPQSGVYVRRQGTKVSKIFVK